MYKIFFPVSILYHHSELDAVLIIKQGNKVLLFNSISCFTSVTESLLSQLICASKTPPLVLPFDSLSLSLFTRTLHVQRSALFSISNLTQDCFGLGRIVCFLHSVFAFVTENKKSICFLKVCPSYRRT